MFMRPPSAQIPATANVENKSKDLVAAAESKSKAAALQSLSSIHDIASAKQNYLSTASSDNYEVIDGLLGAHGSFFRIVQSQM